MEARHKERWVEVRSNERWQHLHEEEEDGCEAERRLHTLVKSHHQMMKNRVGVTHLCMRHVSTHTSPTMGWWSMKPRAMINSASVWPGSMGEADKKPDQANSDCKHLHILREM